MDEKERFTVEDAAFLKQGELTKIRLALRISNFSDTVVTRDDVAKVLGMDVARLITILVARKKTKEAITLKWGAFDIDEPDDERNEERRLLKEQLPDLINKPPLEQLAIYFDIMAGGEFDVFLEVKSRGPILDAMKRVARGGSPDFQTLKALKSHFAEDLTDFFLFVNILEKHGFEALKRLGDMLDQNQCDPRFCEVLKLAAKDSGSHGLKLINEAREVSEGDDELFYNTCMKQ